MNLQKIKPWRCKSYLRWVRSLPCLLTGRTGNTSSAARWADMSQKYMDKQSHGGKREGAGRHKSLEKRIKTSITLKPDDKKWLDSNLEKTSNLIDIALVLLRKYKVDK